MYKVVDLFSGCGGASLGFKEAGYDVVAAVDNDQVSCQTYTENIGLEPLCQDLRRYKGCQILEESGLSAGEVDVVVGCPPCQGFSSLRKTRYPDGKDSRNGLVNVFIKRIKEINPRAVIFENVSGMTHRRGMRFLKFYLRKMKKMGYETSWRVLNTADYGIPQHRRRVIAFSIKGADTPPPPPPSTHTNPDTSNGELRSWSTVQEAIGDLPPLSAGESHPTIPNHTARCHTPQTLKIISAIPKDGGSRKSLPRELWLPCHRRIRRNGGASNVYGRMSWGEPSQTITCRCISPSCGRFIHPEQDRAITPREAARLQTFPDDFVFPKRVGQTEVLIGNAVPVSFMTVLAKHLQDFL